MAKEKKEKTEFKRWWQFLIYPESAPKNFLENLQKKYSFILSPLHDKDINELDNEKKKAHYHCILYFEGKKSYNQVLNITKDFNSPIPQEVINPTSAIQYLIHKNDPLKYQYSKNDIKFSSDIDIEKYFELTQVEEREIQLKILDLIENSKIVDYDELQYYLRDNQNWEEFDYIVKHTYWASHTLTAKRCRLRDQNTQPPIKH